MKKTSKTISYIIVVAMIATVLAQEPLSSISQAAAKAKLSKKTLTLTVGKSKKLTLKNVKKSIAKKATWKTSKKKVATVSKKGTVKGKKAGKATITCTYKLAGKKKKLSCKVTVKKAKQTQNTVQVVPTQAPAIVTPALATPTLPTPAPPAPEQTPETVQEEKTVTLAYKSIDGKLLEDLSCLQSCNIINSKDEMVYSSIPKSGSYKLLPGTYTITHEMGRAKLEKEFVVTKEAVQNITIDTGLAMFMEL